MSPRLTPLEEQVIVVTGASRGTGSLTQLLFTGAALAAMGLMLASWLRRRAGYRWKETQRWYQADRPRR